MFGILTFCEQLGRDHMVADKLALSILMLLCRSLSAQLITGHKIRLTALVL